MLVMLYDEVMSIVWMYPMQSGIRNPRRLRLSSALSGCANQQGLAVQEPQALQPLSTHPYGDSGVGGPRYTQSHCSCSSPAPSAGCDWCSDTNTLSCRARLPGCPPPPGSTA